MNELVICGQVSEDPTVRRQVDQDCESILGNLLLLVSISFFFQPRMHRIGSTYWPILHQNFEVPNWQQLFGFEDTWLGCRIWDKIFYRNCSNLRIWAGDEAHKLYKN